MQAANSLSTDVQPYHHQRCRLLKWMLMTSRMVPLPFSPEDVVFIFSKKNLIFWYAWPQNTFHVTHAQNLHWTGPFGNTSLFSVFNAIIPDVLVSKRKHVLSAIYGFLTKYTEHQSSTGLCCAHCSHLILLLSTNPKPSLSSYQVIIERRWVSKQMRYCDECQHFQWTTLL